jgi:hypothetical protein
MRAEWRLSNIHHTKADLDSRKIQGDPWLDESENKQWLVLYNDHTTAYVVISRRSPGPTPGQTSGLLRCVAPLQFVFCRGCRGMRRPDPPF